MDFQDLLSRVAVALGIGLLFGLERGWKTRAVEAGSRTAGVRTFAITGLLGGIVGAIGAAQPDPLARGLIIGLGLAAYAVAITVFSRAENIAKGSYSATTAVAGILTFALGAYAAIGDLRVAAAAAVAAVGILAMREELHAWIARLTWPELRSVFVLAAMTFIALPLMPDAPIKALAGLNPRQVWIIAIVLAGASFLGYAAVRIFGAQRGTLLAAFTGGLISSTAVTIASARRAAEKEGTPRLLAAGVAIASAVMFVRVAIIVAALNPALLAFLIPPLAGATIAALGYGLPAVFTRAAAAPHKIEFQNPFELRAVLGYTLFLAAVIVLGRVVSEHLGPTGVTFGAAAVGLGDVDAITVSMSKLAPATLSPLSAAIAILAAVAANTLAKLGIAGVLARGRFVVEVLIVTLASLVAGGLGFWLALGLAGVA